MSEITTNAPNYIPVQQAREMSGLRVAFTRGLPGPWSMAARIILDFKAIDYVVFPQELGGSNDELKEWTGQTSAPVAMFNNDRPRVQWSEILILAEQLQPEPPLIPADEDQRMAMFGLCQELCGDDGLGWNLRLLAMLEQRETNPGRLEWLFPKYGSPVDYPYVVNRLNTIIAALARRLERQLKTDSCYFVGNRLSAADIYWTAFSNMLNQMADDICKQTEVYKGLGERLCAHLDSPMPQILLDHREYVVRKYVRLPIEF